jgi:RNA polymerase sigma factor (sigma-70 family)
MDENEWLVDRFEANRTHLRAVAYRMLGSSGEADDAVQESWIRFSRSDTTTVDNLAGWLTTTVARVCLDMLRSRNSRREEFSGTGAPELVARPEDGGDPEHDAVLADSIGPALLVVLATLAPAERLAFVLHDMFALPFDEIAPIVDRTPEAARQLASRARRRVQGGSRVDDVDIARQREVVDAFLAASRGGDFDALLAVLDPDVVLRADRSALPAGMSAVARGAASVGRRAMAGHSPLAEPALVNGSVGIVVASRGRLARVLALTIVGARIVEIDVIADPARLDELDLAVLPE